MGERVSEPSKHAQYCPFCQRHIEPERDELGDIYTTDSGGMFYVHDEVIHDEDYTFTPLN